MAKQPSVVNGPNGNKISSVILNGQQVSALSNWLSVKTLVYLMQSL